MNSESRHEVHGACRSYAIPVLLTGYVTARDQSKKFLGPRQFLPCPVNYFPEHFQCPGTFTLELLWPDSPISDLAPGPGRILSTELQVLSNLIADGSSSNCFAALSLL